MRLSPERKWLLATLAMIFLLAWQAWLTPGKASSQSKNADPVAIGHPSMESPQFHPIVVHQGRVFVANTPAGTVDVMDVKTRKVVTRVPVGVDPVCVAVRPKGKEVWVANHVSDSVSVIDTDPASPTFLHVIATIQEFEPGSRRPALMNRWESPLPARKRRMSPSHRRTESR